MRGIRFFCGLVACAFISLSSVGAFPCKAKLTELSGSSKYEAAVGKPVWLHIDGEVAPRNVVFLGKLIRLNGTAKDFAFFDAVSMQIHLFPQDQVTWEGGSSGEPSAQPIVRSINQEGPTCAAFSIFNCIRQLHYQGLKGNGAVEQKLAEEQDRTRLLVRVINDYYLDNNHTDAIPNVFRELGFKHYEIPNDSVSNFVSGLRKHLASGWPVLLRFDVSSSMATVPYEMIDHKDGARYDRRLWVPRSSSERYTGGHKILALGVFETGGQEYVLVVDPNWQAPRLWSIREFDKLFSAEIRGWVIWEERS